jgi:membrane protein required for colicin V production
MNGLDVAILLVVVLSALLAAAHGFLLEIFSLAGLAAGFVLASWQYGRVAAWFLPHVKSAWTADILGFLVVFLAVVVVAGMVARILRWLLHEAGLRWFDRILGAAFGALRGVLMAAVMLLSLTTFAPDSGWLRGSALAPYFLVVARAVSWLAPTEVRTRFREGADAVGRARHGEFNPPAQPARQ